MLSSVVLLGLAGVALGASNCEDFSGCSKEGGNCPSYSVVETADSFQLRSYPKADYASACNGRASFWNLFQYISGENADGRKIPMTAPVIMTKKGPPACPQKMSFYIHGGSMPQPTGQGVVADPQAFDLVAVRCWDTVGQMGFRGQARARMEQDQREHMAQLKADLAQAGLVQVAQTEYTLGYNSPWAQEKHHEVMLRVARND